MYKVKHDLSPPFMKDIFSEIDRKTRSGNSFSRPNVETVKRGDRSLRNFGPIVWNDMIPDSLKNCETLDKFKSSIKTWKPDNCPCELCKMYIKGLGYTVLSEWNCMGAVGIHRLVSNYCVRKIRNFVLLLISLYVDDNCWELIIYFLCKWGRLLWVSYTDLGNSRSRGGIWTLESVNPIWPIFACWNCHEPSLTNFRLLKLSWTQSGQFSLIETTTNRIAI